MKTKIKIVSLLMAAAITTGVGGYGTYAYFTDSDSLKNEVNITMGKLDVKAYWATDANADSWRATSKVTEVVDKDGGKTLSFENVKPGDTFERDIIVANYGTLKADTTVEFNPKLVDGLKLEMVNFTSQHGHAQIDPNVPNRVYENGMEVRDFIKMTIRVTVPTNAGNDWMEKLINTDAQEFVKVGAHQVIEQ